MAIFDYLLIAVFLLSALLGLLRGLVKEALSLLSWILAIWSAVRFGATVAEMIPSLADGSYIEVWVARIIVLLAVLILSGLLTRLIAIVIHQSGLSGTDRVVGMVFGMARGIVVVSLVVLMLDAAGFDQDSWWQESKLIPYAASLAERLGAVAEDGIGLIQDRVEGVPLP
ncbi:MAG: CvpA family protein [Gammaproteobacteria bacterium]|nr:CvpA family protein [Gammaproteobacteria bacterium]MDP7154658.1 CvpA family protein [Gammaproteobacteria bacterium]MDP7296892.1 CvpA family protein [Gammaproteobacteria bacterium]MDP7418932.1 CvpA family protein [Gammaproteobacteria bacterium]MDP7661180.1 CvpA family protein [Gammaproteobacteria bacterium]